MLVSSSFSLFSGSSQDHLPASDPLWIGVGPLAEAGCSSGVSLALLLTVPGSQAPSKPGSHPSRQMRAFQVQTQRRLTLRGARTVGSPPFLPTPVTRAAPSLKALHPGQGSLRPIECAPRCPASPGLAHVLHPSWIPRPHGTDEDGRFRPQLSTLGAGDPGESPQPVC